MSEVEMKIDNQLCFSLYRLSKFVTQKYQPFLNKIELTYPQYLVFLVLCEKGPQSVKSLGEILSLDSGTLSPLLKRLEDKKFIEKKKSAADERSVSIELTASGRDLLQEAKCIPGQMTCNLPWAEGELSELKERLDKLYKDWSNCQQSGRC